MQNAIDAVIETVGSLVSGLSPVAKAVVPSGTALAVALVNMALAGDFDTTSIVVLACGVLTSLAVYLIPNRAKPAPAPAPAKASRS